MGVTLAGAGTVATLDAGGIAASAPVVTGGVEGPVAGSWPFTRADGCPMLGPWAWAPAACDVAAAPISARGELEIITAATMIGTTTTAASCWPRWAAFDRRKTWPS